MNGYHRLAALIGKYDDLAIFRQFKAAHVRNLLGLQAELIDLELDLAKAIRKDECSGDRDRQSYDTYFRRLRDSADYSGEAGIQLRLVLRERDLLKEYDECLFNYEKLCNLPLVNRSDLHTLREWFADERGGNDFFCGSEGDVWQKGIESDLTSLGCRGQKQDHMAQWLEDTVVESFNNTSLAKHFKHDQKLLDPFLNVEISTPIKLYSDTAISNTVSTFSTILSSLMPTVAIFTLYFVRPPLTRMGMILAFNFLFSTALAVVAKAKRADCFAATAAFAAVQVVFIGGADMVECKCTAST